MGHRGYSGNHPRYSRSGDERYDAKEAYNKDLTASARLHYLENDRHDHESPMHKHNRAHRLRERAIRISERSGAERGDEYDYENPTVMNLLNKANTLDQRSNSGNANMTRHIRPKPKVKVDDERSGEERRKDIDEMIYERPDSPFNSGHEKTVDYFSKRNDEPFYGNEAARALDSVKSNKYFFNKNRDLKKALDKGDDERSNKIKIDLQNFDNTSQAAFINKEHQDNLQAKQDERDEQTRALIAQYERENNSSSPMNACAKSEGGSGCIKQMGGAWRVISNKTDKPWPAKYASKSKAEAALRGYHAG